MGSVSKRLLQENYCMSIVHNYISGLKKAYCSAGCEKIWSDFEDVCYGAKEDSIQQLLNIYPDIPASLVELLKTVDGTYHRNYKGTKVSLYFLGSDLVEFPYYLLSSDQMIESEKEMTWLEEYINREYEDLRIDDRITDDAGSMNWLHFADCMNNGGSSQLFIDFSPSSSGIKGQIVRYLSDPDELEVMADSFDEYLQMLVRNNYDFINQQVL